MSIATTAAGRGRKFALLATVLAAPAVLASAVHAQTPQAATNALPEIVVTAQKRSENIQAVPLAVTAIGGGELLKRGIAGNEDLARIVPSLSFTELSPGQNSLSLRGLTNGYGLSPTVAYYVDEVPMDFRQDAKSGTPSVDMFDAARVEVLRGPQGTLFGSSSLGGTVRVILNQPDPTHFSMHAEAGLNTVDGGGTGYVGKIALNAPLNDKLAVRVTATHQRVAGFTELVKPVSYYSVSPGDTIADTDSNYADLSSVRAALTWMPDSTWTITPSVYYQHVKAYGYNYSDQNRPQYQYVRGFTDVNTDKLFVANLVVKKDFGFAALTSSTSYTYMDQDSFEDYSASYARRYVALVKSNVNVPFFPTTNYEPIPYYEYTQEVRLSSNDTIRWLGWTLGAYYSSLKEKERQAVTSAAYGAFYSARNNLPNSSNIFDYQAPTLDVQYAGFADLSLKPIPQVEITAGVRGYKLDQKSRITQFGLTAGANVPENKGSEDGYNPRFNVNFKPTDDLSFYATASKGFRAGGPNTQLLGGVGITCSLIDLFNASYQPDSVWNYEGGAKTQFFGKKLTFNSAVYQIDWSNIQGSLSSTCGTFIANFGAARIKGAETEIALRPIPGLTLNASASYNDARYQSFKPGVAASLGLHPGQRLVNTPRIKYTLGGEYDFNVFTKESYVRVDMQHVGSTPTSLTFQTPSYYRPAYTNIDASIGVYYGPTEIQLYVKNLTNEYETIGIVNSQVQTYQENVVAPPRTIGVTVRYALR